MTERLQVDYGALGQAWRAYLERYTAMPTINSGAGGIVTSAAAPVAGTDEIQTLTIDATGGTFKLSFEGFTTTAITWVNVNATLVAAIDAALEALPSIGTGGVTTAAGTMTAGVGTATITFTGNRAKQAIGSVIAVANNSLTGTATCSIAETTPGVDATSRGAAKGTLLVDGTNAKLYINTGTALAPTWTVVGTQT